MNFYGSSEEHEPVTWVRGHAIYAAHFVVLIFVVSMLTAGLLMALRIDAILAFGSFESAKVLHGEVWRIFTYGLVNPPTRDRVLWFAIDMLMLAWFGREVEKFFGRRKFLGLFAGIYLAPPLLFTALGAWMPTMFAGETGAFAIFVAFAVLYPSVPVFFTLLAKWIAIILVGIYSLAAVAEHDWITLLSLWSTTGFAYGFVRYQQGHFNLPRMKLPRRKPKLRVVRNVTATTAASPRAPLASTAEIDALLDKIAESGFASLTAKERAKLEAARQELKKRSDG